MRRFWVVKGLFSPENGLKLMTAIKTFGANGGRVLNIGPRLFNVAVTMIGSLQSVSLSSQWGKKRMSAPLLFLQDTEQSIQKPLCFCI